MHRLWKTISDMRVPRRSLAVFWLGQAGFAFKTPGGRLIFIDAYLSNMCETTEGGNILSKRLFPSLLKPEELTRGIMASTHAHEDHLDEESVALIAESSSAVRFAGPASSIRTLERLGVQADRTHLLKEGSVCEFDGFSIRAVHADHGDSEPDAVGIVLDADGTRVYHTGDTSYCPERMEQVIELKPDVIIPCINGAFGNLNAVEAARLCHDVGATVAIPCHFWMFICQNTTAEGTPAGFLEACRELAPGTEPVILTAGEPYVFTESER